MKTKLLNAITRIWILLLVLSAVAFGQMRIQTITIEQGASESSALKPMGANMPGYIIMPAAWTAASLSVEISVDRVTWSPVYETYDNIVLIGATQGRAYRLSPGDFWASPYIRFRSVNTSGVAVNQAATRPLIVVWK